MKVFIVFIALLMVSMTFITYQGDLNRYVRLQTFMKAVAEEAAAGAALYYDEVAYSNGSMVINREEGEKYIEYLLTRAEQTLDLKEGESLTAEMEVMDDGSGAAEQGVSPSVTVTLRLTVADLFRLPFLSREQVVRSAKYELADY
jgi:ABC-type Fe3+ transport system substrate-binding protein